MNKNTIKIFSLVIGIISGVAAVLEIIRALLNLDAIGVLEDTKYDAYVIIGIILSILLAAALGVMCFFIVKEYISTTDEAKYVKYPAIAYFSYQIIHSIFVMVMWGFDNGTAWVGLIFSLAGLILLLINKISAGVDENVKGILVLVGLGLGFILSTYYLFNSQSLSILINLIYDALFVMIILHCVFNMIISGTLKIDKSSNAKELNEQEKENNE